MSTLEAFLPLFEPESLAKIASKKAYAAGVELFEAKAVSDIVFAGNCLKGKVKGSHPQPHATTIKLLESGAIEATCDCPTYTDGWEKICHHAVALGLALRKQYQAGGEITLTQNPWTADVAGTGANAQRYTIEARRGNWHVMAFRGGGTPVVSRRRYEGMSPADRVIHHYLSQEVDDADDGGHVIDDMALSGLLYFARVGSTVSLKGVGKLQFAAEPLTLRVRAEPRPGDNSVVLHAFLEQRSTGRDLEVPAGRIIVGAPTWYLLPETAEVFLVPDTPPWVLEAVAKQPRIVMDARVSAQAMDALSESLKTVGVPHQDLFALASDSRKIDAIIATVEGDAAQIKVGLAARYGNVTIGVTGSEPESARYTINLGDQPLSFYRDLEGEAVARKTLTDLGLKYNPDADGFIATGDAAVEFTIVGIPLLPETWEKRVPQLPRVRSKSPTPRLAVRSKEGSVLDLDAIVDVEGEEDLISFRDLLRWLHEGRRWITLADGSVAKLDPQILQPIAEAAGAIEFDKKGHAEISTLELGTLTRLLGAVPSADVAKEVKRLMENMTGERSAKAPKRAKSLTAKLREYQRSGFAWLWQLHENQMTGILADDMGLGKTVQALALLTKAKEEEGDQPTLIVCPTSVLSVWKQEVKKWAPSLVLTTWHGAERAENRRMLKKADIVVTTYAILRRDIDELSKIRWRYAILDEAQYIKNWATTTAKSAKQLTADHRLALSGTPVENHLADLWAIFDFLAPNFLGKLSDFQKNYVRPIEENDTKTLEALRARIRPFVMRRKKEDVAQELPPKTEQTLFVQFGRSQLGLYNRILKTAKDEIKGRIEEVGLEKSQMTILAALTRLRQVCCDPRLLGLPDASTLPPSAKLDAFKELMADCVGSGRKVLVFSQFVEMQKLLGDALTELKIPYLWLHGGTKNREELVQQFQNKSGPPVFLISLKAGGSGLTLTEADTVVHFDPWWNPAVEDQATDRAHRIGQDKPVMVYRLVCEDTVEQKMVELGARKREVAESALGRDVSAGKKLTMEDVEALLETPSAAATWDQ
ncbi:SNF2-related protein [Nannocystis pusilla]|uniref:SNF2-related protein n=1 Tax=Nannocystis pusilla TaxID=889268 RepID=A0A9X3F453_9BACT|nr:SNF2-related protein [Nannocystis pusilla]